MENRTRNPRTAAPGGADAAAERRRHRRAAALPAVMAVTQAGRASTHLVSDLSAGGAFLLGAPPIPVGHRIHLALCLPGRSPLRLDAQVLRDEEREHRTSGFAVAFVDVPAATEDVIQAFVLWVLEDEQPPELPIVLVLDDDEGVRRALIRAVRSLGEPAVAVATPLDALRFIESPAGAALRTVIVDLRLGPANGLDLLAYLAAERPDLRTVLMSGQAPVGEFAAPAFATRVAAVLTKPWNRETFAEAIGSPPRPTR